MEAVSRAILDVTAAIQPAGQANVALVLLDVSRAFDQTSTSAIVLTMQRRNVPADLVSTIASFISNRELCVRVDGALSVPFRAGSGVPQGSLLAPTLFNATIDPLFDLPLPPEIKLIGYADDLLVTGPARTLADISRIQQALHDIERVLAGVGLSLNASKCEMLVTSFSKPPALPTLHLLNNEPIPRVSHARYLGISFDARLSTCDHWNDITRTVRSVIGKLGRMTGGHRPLLRIATSGLVFGTLSYHLPIAPPPTHHSWTSVKSAVAYAARIYCNEWRRGVGANNYRWAWSDLEVIQAASFPDPYTLSVVQSLRWLYKSLIGGRRFKQWITVITEPGRTRSECRRAASTLPLRLALPPFRHAHLTHLQPFFAIILWNALRWDHVPSSPAEILSSLHSFTTALPLLLPHLHPTSRPRPRPRAQ
jgi:hypothetical protein